MQDSAVAGRLREQIERFSGIFYPRFSKPQQAFLTEMIYGIQAAQDVKLSNIARVLGEEIKLKKTEERLSHHLATGGMWRTINEVLARDGAEHVNEDTLVVVDPTDIAKPYARRMPYLAKVRDGSRKELVPGYWSCLAVACDPDQRRVIPLHMRLWSTLAPDFGSENQQLLSVVRTVHAATQGRGIFVIDRGGDRIELLRPFLNDRVRFIVRLVGDRDLIYRGQKILAKTLAEGCRMRHAERIVRQTEEGEKAYQLEFGFLPVHLPNRTDDLALVVVRGFGETPLLLLTNVQVLPSRASLWSVVQGYLGRWMVEETLRFIKQSYRLEEIRVLKYERLQNLVALVAAAAYFAAVWLGEGLRLSVLRCAVTRLAKRFFGIPAFHYYALADGICDRRFETVVELPG
jgi:hypothetical protein